jgi:meso-butanediol dehydrogenase / (S,S)-butanediol dehydrogenase / diacetyl reductase
MRLPNTVSFVTGAGSGIGRAIAERFAREGSRVVAVGRRAGPVEETARLIGAASGSAIAIACDVTDTAAVDAAVRQAVATFGPIDILVNNAGGSYGDDILTIDEETWDRNFDLVLKSVYRCSRAVLPSMIERRRGNIVNIASVNGMTGIGEEAYGAAKAGMINLTQNMAVKYGRFGVRANVVAPGTVRTPIWAARIAQRPTVFDELAAWYPLGRVGEADDVANAALFLASDEAGWITGVTLPVDGGLLAGSYRMNMDLRGPDDEGVGGGR